jgi:hypothetical protein
MSTRKIIRNGSPPARSLRIASEETMGLLFIRLEFLKAMRVMRTSWSCNVIARQMSKILCVFSAALILVTTGHDSLDAGDSLPTRSQSAANTVQKPDTFEFKETLMGERQSTNGAHSSFHAWKASDGVVVNSSTGQCDSVAQAKKAFLKRVSESSQVTEKGPRFNAVGKKTGERAVVIFLNNPFGPPISAVLWTDGSVFHDIESYSLRHVRGFEQTFYPSSNSPTESSHNSN